MYVGGLICQKTVDWSHFGSSEVIQRFCPRSQRVVATVCLFVKSGVKWHLLTNRQTVTLSTGIHREPYDFGSLGPGQLGPGKLGSGKLGLGKLGPRKLGPGQLGPGQG